MTTFMELAAESSRCHQPRTLPRFMTEADRASSATRTGPWTDRLSTRPYCPLTELAGCRWLNRWPSHAPRTSATRTWSQAIRTALRRRRPAAAGDLGEQHRPKERAEDEG